MNSDKKKTFKNSVISFEVLSRLEVYLSIIFLSIYFIFIYLSIIYLSTHLSPYLTMCKNAPIYHIVTGLPVSPVYFDGFKLQLFLDT